MILLHTNPELQEYADKLNQVRQVVQGDDSLYSVVTIHGEADPYALDPAKRTGPVTGKREIFGHSNAKVEVTSARTNEGGWEPREYVIDLTEPSQEGVERYSAKIDLTDPSAQDLESALKRGAQVLALIQEEAEAKHWN